MSQAVTYELSPGRFADNLISYIHAKWISYKYQIPLLYKPFIYSDQLLLHEHELRYNETVKNGFSKTIILGRNVSVDLNDTLSTLYIAPYFPESKYELSCCVNFSGKAWDYFVIDWNDIGFINALRKVIAPTATVMVPHMHMPMDRISVAVHVRRGGNHDTPETLPGFPLKFLPNDFYIRQIKNLYYMLNKHPLYVYLFSDDNNPLGIVHKFEHDLSELDIQFNCRKMEIQTLQM